MPPSPCQQKDHIIQQPSCERRQVQSSLLQKTSFLGDSGSEKEEAVTEKAAIGMLSVALTVEE